MRNANKRLVSKEAGRGLLSSVASLPGKTLDIASGVAGTVLNRAVNLLPFEAHIPGY